MDLDHKPESTMYEQTVAPNQEQPQPQPQQQKQHGKKNDSFLSHIKTHPFIIFYSLGANVSAFLWGFDLGVSTITTALPGFKMHFGYEYAGELLLSATWNALWSAMTAAGMLIGGLLCGYVADFRGRRLGIIAGSCISMLGVGLMYAAETPGLLLAAKTINGIALGFFLTLAPMYASEIAPTELRPVMTAAVNLFINAGQLTAIGIGNTRFTIMNKSSYKVMFASQWAFVGFVLFFAIIMPESPWYLVRKSRLEDARKSLARLHSAGTDVSQLISEISASVSAEQEVSAAQQSVSYIACFQGANFRRTRIVCGMFIIQQFSGIAFYAQSLYFLGISGLPIALTFQLALAGFGVAMLGNIASWFVMDYVGRRTLVLFGLIINGLLLIGIGIAGTVSTSASLYFIAYAVNFSQLLYAPTIGAVSWALSAETSSTTLRAKTQSLATATNALLNWIMNFITPYLINNDEANLGGKAAFVWAGLTLFSFVWAWFEVPEFKGRDFAALDFLFEQRTPTRKFRTTDVPTASTLALKTNQV